MFQLIIFISSIKYLICLLHYFIKKIKSHYIKTARNTYKESSLCIKLKKTSDHLFIAGCKKSLNYNTLELYID